ncbi:zinc finger, CCHC-type containing protein [Tanacetum coccineum]|uniref:Zinc finger, CCHC-type containing protein n=1 Tax=Tanacetum coccineum TaxID=301880 RepID=A0ABQ4XBX9_9ASTR
MANFFIDDYHSRKQFCFRGFFEKQKLTGPNFIEWYRQLRIVLSAEDKLNYLELPFPAAPVPAVVGQQVPLETLAAHAAWVKGQKEIVVLMLMTMELDLQWNLETLDVHDMFKELKTLFSQQAEKELLQTVREFHSCKQEEGQYLSLYVLKMKRYIDNLECLGYPVSLNLAVSLMLVSLRKEYDSFVQNYNMQGIGKTVNELHAMLKLHEKALPKRDAPTVHAIRAGKIPPPPKKGDPAKDSVCHHCGDTCHWKHNCLQYLFVLLKNKKLPQGASTSGIFTIELFTFPKKSWVYDTGCGTHICNTTQGLKGSKKLKPRALSLYMGNGQRAAVKVIGSYDLCFPSGLVIFFDDNNTISVSGNNLVYFSAIPRDGIYEIDLSNSNTNNSSMYAVRNKKAKLNLDFSLLCHCCLGHISKKRIKKLQHDGLLNSIDIKSFENQEFLDHLKEHGIISHHTPPYTPQRNGVYQRRNKTLLDMVRSMMSQTTLPKSFWDYALESAASILNMVPTKKVEKTPYKVWTRHAPDRMCLNIKADEYKLGDLNEPANYKAALLDPESGKWINAMNVEMQYIKDKDV